MVEIFYYLCILTGLRVSTHNFETFFANINLYEELSLFDSYGTCRLSDC